jgi:hypothetical protein
LVIERFFITIKAEIDREIRHLQRKQKKRGKRNLKCDTGVESSVNSSRDRFIQSSTATHTAYSSNHSNPPASSNRSYFTPQAHHHMYASDYNESNRSNPCMYQQYHQAASPSSLSRNSFQDYQSRCMNASGYSDQPGYATRHGAMSYQNDFEEKISMRRAPTNSDESSVQSINLTQTRSETELRLAKLQYEVAGLVNRYQVAEDELQSVGHSMGNSTAGESTQNILNGTTSQSLHSSESGASQENNTNKGYRIMNSLNNTPPRAPLQQRINHLDITPPRVSYSQHQRTPSQYDCRSSLVPPQPYHQRSSTSLHAPVPMRYTSSSPHPHDRSGRTSPLVHQELSYGHIQYQDQRFPTILSASQSNHSVKNDLSIASSHSNSFVAPHEGLHLNQGPSAFNYHNYHPQGFFGQYSQSPSNYHGPFPSYENQRNQNQRATQPGIPRTPSGRQF